MRGNPLSVPWASLLAVIGGACIVLGFILPVGSEFPGGRVLDVILWSIAVIVSVPGWLLAFAIIRSTRKARRQPIGDVPDELPEPPSDHDPAQVAVLVGEGRPSRRAVAGTLLALADRGAVEIEEYGDKIVVRLQPDAEPANERERLVLDGLRANAEPNGDVVGPPIWKDRVPWWRAFARDARKQTLEAGLVDPTIPFVAFGIAFTFTAVGVSFAMFERVLVFVGIIPFAHRVHSCARQHWRLPPDARRTRAAGAVGGLRPLSRRAGERARRGPRRGGGLGAEPRLRRRARPGRAGGRAAHARRHRGGRPHTLRDRRQVLKVQRAASRDRLTGAARDEAPATIGTRPGHRSPA